jgi:hypothetical protein
MVPSLECDFKSEMWLVLSLGCCFCVKNPVDAVRSCGFSKRFFIRCTIENARQGAGQSDLKVIHTALK